MADASHVTLDRYGNPSGPYEFSGRIAEAFYTNPELDTIQIVYIDENDVARDYYIRVDEEDHQFQAFLKEFSLDSVDECTRNNHETTRQEFRDAFQRYAERNSMWGYGDIPEPEGVHGIFKNSAAAHFIFEYNSEDAEHKEMLFKLKLHIFELDVVKKSKKRKIKTAIRKSQHPLLVFKNYLSFIEDERKFPYAVIEEEE